jgi:peptidoglycan/LPS O-acetylase OafA/YrhL
MPGIPTTQLTYGTFGAYRWLLACSVVLTHLGPFNGAIAVQAFFILSGYTAAWILDNRYLNLNHGLAKFYLNRALRIYPQYWLVVLLVIPITLRFPLIAFRIDGVMTMPTHLGQWLINIFCFGAASQLGFTSDQLLVPPVWSLAVELQWWCVMPLVMRYRSFRFLFLTAAFLYLCFVEMVTLATQQWIPFVGFFAALSGMFLFAFGLLLYWRKKRGWKDMPVKCAVIVAASLQILSLAVICKMISPPHAPEILWAANIATIYALSGIDSSRIPLTFQQIDYIMGRLAYPVFLTHMAVGVLLIAAFPSLQYLSWQLFLAGLGASNALALFLCVVIETPVERLRRHFKC